jgi:penicillin amidase
MQRMQYDQISPSARWVAPYLGQLATDDPQLEPVIRRMRNWNGALTVESPEASIYEVFMRRVIPLMLADKLGDLTERYAGRGPTPLLAEGSLWGSRSWEWLQKTLGDPDSPWFDLGQGEKRDDVLRMALSDSLEYLRKRLGSDIDGWAWGKLHQLTFHHVLGRGKPLDLLFNRGPYPVGGDGTTLWASLSQFEGSETDTSLIGPPFRFIADLADLRQSLGILVPGQSGQPSSPYYDDQVEGWFQGKYHPMLYAREDVERESAHCLVIEPGDSPSGQAKAA